LSTCSRIQERTRYDCGAPHAHEADDQPLGVGPPEGELAVDHRLDRHAALGVLDVADASAELHARVLARADEEDLGDEDVAAGELVHEVGEEREVAGVERVPARREDDTPCRRGRRPPRSSASTVSWDFSGMVFSGCFQTTCDFASSGRATIISETPRLNQPRIPILSAPSSVVRGRSLLQPTAERGVEPRCPRASETTAERAATGAARR
jgi:hypothetical protein